MDSSPDNDGTGQYCQMVRVRQQDRKAYVRNQRLKAPQKTQRLEPGGSGPRSNAHPHSDTGWGTLWSVYVAGREAMVNACGVAVAMLQGHSWTPTLSNGWEMNVGTIPPVPSPVGIVPVGGKACCRLIPVGWGGGPVVVRGRESVTWRRGPVCSQPNC